MIALLALPGCMMERPTPMPTPERRVTYSCDRGPGLTVVYERRAARIVTPGDDRGILLPQKRSGSGFFYQSATHSIRGKGDEITYTVGRMVPMTCRSGPGPMPR